MLYNIWIDDVRKPFHKDNLVYFTNAEDAIKWFKSDEITPNDSFNLYLDHDLGLNKSGYDFAKWFIEWNYEKKHFMKYQILSMNPVGRYNIRELFRHYGYDEL